MNMTIETHPSIIIENKSVEAINDPEALGVYTYMKMLIDHETTQLSLIIEQLCKHFSMSEDQALYNIRLLNKLGFMMVKKDKN